MRQAVVLGLSLIPFVFATLAAFATWELLEPMHAIWRLISMVIAWVVLFASGTQVFWRVVGQFSPETAA
jgi:ABC-type Na+ efflux pump permease subunit